MWGPGYAYTINPFGLGTNRLHDPTHMIRVSIAG